jgi:hypothetical protein
MSKLTTKTYEDYDNRFKKEMYDVKIGESTVKTTPSLAYYLDVFIQLVNHARMKVVNCTEGGLLQLPLMSSLKDAIELYCKNDIKKKDIFAVPKRKRRKK